MLFGMYGLFGDNQRRAYVVEVYQAPSPRWSGRMDPGSLVLQEAFMQVMSIDHLPGSYHS